MAKQHANRLNQLSQQHGVPYVEWTTMTFDAKTQLWQITGTWNSMTKTSGFYSTKSAAKADCVVQFLFQVDAKDDVEKVTCSAHKLCMNDHMMSESQHNPPVDDKSSIKTTSSTSFVDSLVQKYLTMYNTLGVTSKELYRQIVKSGYKDVTDKQISQCLARLVQNKTAHVVHTSLSPNPKHYITFYHIV